MIRNFLFHRVSPERDIFWDPMDVELFEKCIKYINQHYEVALIEELAFSEDRFTKNKYATIMFDDGYKDNIEYAADILEKYKCKASFYVVTNCIDNLLPTWTHLLEHTFQNTAINDIDLSFDSLPDDFKIKKLTSKNERINYLMRLKPVLKSMKHEDRNNVIERVVSTYVDAPTPEMMMSWKDLEQLKNAGHIIGSHTLSHCMLGTMDDEKEIEIELRGSAETIQKRLGHFPVTISYPVGSYNENIKKMSREAGYKIGLAVKQNTFNPQKEDLFEISRIELYNEPWWKTKLRISNILEEVKSLIRYK